MAGNAANQMSGENTNFPNKSQIPNTMSDDSYLDKQYFINNNVYNCPFCNRRHVSFRLVNCFDFDWSDEKQCYVYIIKCNSCNKMSMQMSFEFIAKQSSISKGTFYFLDNIDIDNKIFYSVPTSFFILDNRINRVLRELITEAEGCLKMNFLTGASACMRKAIYELLVIEKCTAKNYNERIKELKSKHKDTDTSLFDILGRIQDMTSDKIHEQSWDEWDSSKLKLIIETLKTVLYDIYVIPAIKKERSNEIKKLDMALKKPKTKGNHSNSPAD